jgi:hypothetical protein
VDALAAAAAEFPSEEEFEELPIQVPQAEEKIRPRSP